MSALHRYLAQEICYYFNKEKSIFMDARDGSNKLTLCEGKSLHLYVSHPPDGDYQDFMDRSVSFDIYELSLAGKICVLRRRIKHRPYCTYINHCQLSTEYCDL